ncbi:MAG: (Fe-S)-binding protein, partial [Marinirhabdus sp.]
AGELHLRPILNLKKKEGVRYFREITTAVAKLVKQYRGSFSGEHGDGIVRAEFLELMVGKQNFELLKTVKNAFDPQNIFNPGKITDAWPMDQSLRTHPGTPAPEVATLLDFSDSGGILRLAEKCNGSGDCRKGAAAPGAMCPSYHVTKNEKDSTRGRANVLREVLLHNKGANKFDSEDLKEAFKLCLSCKACATECPSNVDIATAKAEFLYRYNKANGVARTDKVFGKSSGHNKKASKFSGLANMLLSNRVSAAILKRAAGVAPKRSLPKISTKSFSKRFQTIKNEMVEGRPNVVLFVDEFSNYLDAEIAEDAFFLLKNLGYNVEAVHHLDSARALMSKGFLEEAKWEVNKNISTLKGKVGPNTPLLGIEPSAILGFRDEYPRLANDVAAARAVSKNTFLIEEFLCAEFKKGAITVQQFTLRPKTIKIHNHCHQKALGSQKTTFEILNIPKNYSPTLIVSGCCGMAGSFGLEKDTYGLSMAIGELKLFPAVRKAPKDVVIAANGTSCRHQIKDGTGVRAEHPVTILRGALAVKPLAGSVKKMPRGYGAVTDTSKILPL